MIEIANGVLTIYQVYSTGKNSLWYKKDHDFTLSVSGTAYTYIGL